MKVDRRKVARTPRKVAKPSLTLTADVSQVKSFTGSNVVSIDVNFKGIEAVELKLEPRGTFTKDLDSLGKPGIVRLRGKKDGIATLIATGKTAAGDAIKKMIHVRCEGPVVRILGYGYIPKN